MDLVFFASAICGKIPGIKKPLENIQEAFANICGKYLEIPLF